MVRKRLELDERRDQLLELGLALFTDRTYADVSIDDIAKAANISKGLLYHYFPTKRAFYLETMRAAARELIDATEPDESVEEPARAQQALTTYLDYVRAHAAVYTALLKSADDEVVELVEGTRSAFVARMLEAVGVPDQRPVFRTIARCWIASVEAASLDWIEHDDVDRDQLIAMLLTLLYWSLRTGMFFDPRAGVELHNPPPF